MVNNVSLQLRYAINKTVQKNHDSKFYNVNRFSSKLSNFLELYFFTYKYLFLHIIVFVVCKHSPTFKQFLKFVTIELYMLLIEPQPNRCLDFTVRSAVMSSKMFFQVEKETINRRRQLVAVRRGVIPDDEFMTSKVCNWYRTELRSKFVVLKEMRFHKNNEFFSLINENTCWLVNHHSRVHSVFKRVTKNLL